MSTEGPSSLFFPFCLFTGSWLLIKWQVLTMMNMMSFVDPESEIFIR